MTPGGTEGAGQEYSEASHPAILLAAINAKWIHPSLALRLLKANLGPLKERCGIVEFTLRQNLDEALEKILNIRPQVLGFSVSIWNHRATLELLEALEERLPPALRPFVVLGGPEVSHLNEDAALFRHAAYVIRGEGEAAFRMLCQGLVEGVHPDDSPEQGGPMPPGTDSCAGQDAKMSPGRPVFVNPQDCGIDLDRIRNAYDLYTDEDLHDKLIYVEASRGCPFFCEFCMSGGNEKNVREFPLGPFLAGMDRLIKRALAVRAQGSGEPSAGGRIRPPVIKFLDRTFNLNVKRARAIMEFFLERLPVGEAPPFCVHFEMHPGNVPPELRETIRRFPPGSLRLEVGIQTLNPRTAALVRRNGTPEEALELISFLCGETEAIVHADLIAGLPGEDMASFARGFDLLWAAAGLGQRNAALGKTGGEGRVEIQPGILKLLPGAPIARRSEEYGMHYDPLPPYEVLETAALPLAECNRIKNFARFWELIVNRDSFPEIKENLFPPGEKVFYRFLQMSDFLLASLGRNWGIDRSKLRSALLAWENTTHTHNSGGGRN